MPWPDRSLVTNALIGLLSNDPTLRAVMPDGVYWARAPIGKQKFILMSLADDAASLCLNNEDGFEWPTYQVKAVASVTTEQPMREAAEQIHELLHHAELNLSASGYQCLVCSRILVIDDKEEDPVDKTKLWWHRGGLYQLQLS